MSCLYSSDYLRCPYYSACHCLCYHFVIKCDNSYREPLRFLYLMRPRISSLSFKTRYVYVSVTSKKSHSPLLLCNQLYNTSFQESLYGTSHYHQMNKSQQEEHQEYCFQIRPREYTSKHCISQYRQQMETCPQKQ